MILKALGKTKNTEPTQSKNKMNTSLSIKVTWNGDNKHVSNIQHDSPKMKHQLKDIIKNFGNKLHDLFLIDNDKHYKCNGIITSVGIIYHLK